MSGFIIFAGVMLIIMAAALFIQVRFEIYFVRQGTNDHLRAEVSLFRGLIRYKAEIPIAEIDINRFKPLVKVKTDAEGVSPPVGQKAKVLKFPLSELLHRLPSYIRLGLKYLKRYRKALKGLLKSIRFRHLSWKTEIGLGDPANTGIATGFLWAAKGLIYGVVSRNVGTVDSPPIISIIPCYQHTCLRLEFHCIFDLRIGNIIIAGLKFVKYRFIS
ncbi:DUF2953 domain-containing protein [Phosphitispora fastidiosa]|uniref:DUF2953 domain-containing protein n=1 Tax=Phosphitispora fastidiosa TaxID=2837202 RepID=UPI001E4D7220|nr:DUF2953 domain-containing protein [Phosphitispora fastidiosa]MBU7005312.1 hypothetical protein [Phosphitispora fastidiosa]